MRLIDHRDLARKHRTKLLQSVACAVGAGKTVAVRAATANLDPSRYVFIYLANPTIGVRGMLTHIVAALGHTPAYHKSAHPRAVNNLALHALTAAFAAEHAIVDEQTARIAISENAAD